MQEHTWIVNNNNLTFNNNNKQQITTMFCMMVTHFLRFFTHCKDVSFTILSKTLWVACWEDDLAMRSMVSSGQIMMNRIICVRKNVILLAPHVHAVYMGMLFTWGSHAIVTWDHMLTCCIHACVITASCQATGMFTLPRNGFYNRVHLEYIPGTRLSPPSLWSCP